MSHKIRQNVIYLRLRFVQNVLIKRNVVTLLFGGHKQPTKWYRNKTRTVVNAVRGTLKKKVYKQLPRKKSQTQLNFSRIRNIHYLSVFQAYYEANSGSYIALQAVYRVPWLCEGCAMAGITGIGILLFGLFGCIYVIVWENFMTYTSAYVFV